MSMVAEFTKFMRDVTGKSYTPQQCAKALNAARVVPGKTILLSEQTTKDYLGAAYPRLMERCIPLVHPQTGERAFARDIVFKTLRDQFRSELYGDTSVDFESDPVGLGDDDTDSVQTTDDLSPEELDAVRELLATFRERLQTTEGSVPLAVQREWVAFKEKFWKMFNR